MESLSDSLALQTLHHLSELVVCQNVLVGLGRFSEVEPEPVALKVEGDSLVTEVLTENVFEVSERNAALVASASAVSVSHMNARTRTYQSIGMRPGKERLAASADSRIRQSHRPIRN